MKVALVHVVVLLASVAHLSSQTIEGGNETYDNSTAKAPAKTTSDVAYTLLTRLVNDVMMNASDSLRGSTNVHDQTDAALKHVALRLNEMGYLLVRMGAALKVAGRRLWDLDSTLSIVFGPAKFKKQKASLWALDIAQLGNCTAETRLAQITAKIINAYAARSRPSTVYKGVDHIGDIVGSTGDSLEDIAVRLAGPQVNGTTVQLPKPELTESGEALLQNIIDVVVKHGAH